VNLQKGSPSLTRVPASEPWGKKLSVHHLSQNIINIFFSHFHLDHIQGLPFFAPAYNKEQRIGILAMGRRGKIKNLKEIFSRQMQEEYFPDRS
jgi:Metal-dependent hydrolases of the beta-lactamase superfamily I